MSDVSYSTMTTKSIGGIVHSLPTRQWGGVNLDYYSQYFVKKLKLI